MGNWQLAGNWNPVGIPGPGEAATIDLVGGALVTGNANIDCSAIYIGEFQANNILIVRYDLKLSVAVRISSQANNQLRLNGTTRDIDVETPVINCHKADGVKFEGVVNVHGPAYDDPCVIEARAGDFTLAASADIEMWWVRDLLHAQFTWTAGAKLRAVRGCQFLALTDNNPEIHVGATRYKLPGSFKGINPFSGGRYSAQDQTKTISKVAHHGSRAAGISWAGSIDDATLKFIKDELQYWCDEGQEVQVFIRDRAIYGYITNMHWRPANIGASPDQFEYEIEFTEVDK